MKSLALLLSTLPLWCEAAAPPPIEKVRKWATEVCIDPSVQRCRRWNVAPLVSCHDANSAERAAFDGAIAKINEALATCPMKLLSGSAPDAQATIHVHFATAHDMPRVNRLYGIARDRSEDHTWVWWNADNTYRRAVVVIARDRVRSDALPAIMTRRLLTTIGFRGVSSEFPDSVFARTQPTLSVMDRRLIALFYAHARAGQSRDSFQDFISARWN